MYFFTSLVASLLALSASTLAAPGDRATTVPLPALFNLQTQVIPGLHDCGCNKNNLWLYSYHTGAGLGDACLSPNKTSAMEAFYNSTSTQQLFTYPNNEIGPWPMEINSIPYSLFSTVTISIASEAVQEGFFYNETGLQYNASFGGWVACDWWHGVPQLFNIATSEAAGPDTARIPRSCSKVNLLPVAV